MTRKFDLRDLCAQVYDDDGADFRRRDEGRRSDGPDHKTMQLCGQVRRLLGAVIAEWAIAQDLPAVAVVDVRPAPDASRLRCELELTGLDDPHEVDRIMTRIRGLTGFWRTEIAPGITRKRLPGLTFEVALPEGREDA